MLMSGEFAGEGPLITDFDRISRFNPPEKIIPRTERLDSMFVASFGRLRGFVSAPRCRYGLQL